MARVISNNYRYKFRRKDADRSFIRQIHIYTEGSVTEPEYLKIVRDKILSSGSCRNSGSFFKLNVKHSGTKSSPNNIRKSIREDIKYCGDKNFNEVWVLMDKDDWGMQAIEALENDRQIALKTSKFNVLVSNPKFEFWLILHFENGFGIMTSSEVDKKIQKHIPGYNKHCDKRMFTRDNVLKAISRAKILKNQNKSAYTDVYRLVERIFALIEEYELHK